MTLKAFRNSAGMSIRKLSEKTGIPESTLWNYEKQNALPSREVAKKLAAAYEMSFRDLEPLVRNKQGMTRAQFEDQANDFKAKFENENTENAEKSAERTEAAPEPIAREEISCKKHEFMHDVNELPVPPIPWQIKTATDADYREAVSAAVKALRAILGADNNGQIMLAVGFITAEIESRLFIQR